ncbi:hypothetical protein B1B04_20695 [Lysinibacillus sp. KCTC 33748]|nr:hypothetical protein B1B04_20695 [Lysinibacillus sp. KCTC 33748]SKC10655.1 hypothetical protein SAMN06295926_12373 [Lysinibacillus sp. AC-3]
MNPCKKNCSCDRCKPCLQSTIKAIDSCQVQPVPLPAYGNFFLAQFVTLNANQPMPWNGTGRTAGGITLNPDTVTIEVAQAGDYYIDYYVLVLFELGTSPDAILGVFVDGNEVNPIQTRYAADSSELDRELCIPISGGTIISIPAGGTVQLRNVNVLPLSTCDGPALAASINLIKLN